MKFEILPNEILVEIFEYLNALDIFNSFDLLNFRFTQLIRNIRLHLRCQYARKSVFDKFCKKMSSNLQIMHNIYSIQLSNNDTCKQIEKFLLNFSLNEFSNLRSLILSDIDKTNLDKLKLMLPFISKLYSFHLISSTNEENDILANLSMSNLRILSISTLEPLIKHINTNSMITNLTLSGCSLDTLYQLFSYTLKLKYLNIQTLCKTCTSVKTHTYIDKYNANNLKELIIGEFKYSFEDLENFFKHITNIKSLTINIYYNIDIIDANRWEYLITNYLSYLKIFKFIFIYYRENENDSLFDRYNQFQSDFWIKQHHWYTEYSLDYCLAYIYTIPYISSHFKLTVFTNRYTQHLINNSNIFDNVNDLILNYKAIIRNCQYYFSNITSLKLVTSLQDYSPVLKVEHLETIKGVVNFFNLKHLDISIYEGITTSSILLFILKEAPQLSSMAINARNLVSLLKEKKLCEYLGKIIKKLDFRKQSQESFPDFDGIEQFCKMFPCIEYLKCTIKQSSDILSLINQLPNLSILNVYVLSLKNDKNFYSQFEEEAHKRNFVFHTKNIDNSDTELNMWVGEKI